MWREGERKGALVRGDRFSGNSHRKDMPDSLPISRNDGSGALLSVLALRPTSDGAAGA
jgi:hypothetical protein